jgi:hypothetical protein
MWSFSMWAAKGAGTPDIFCLFQSGLGKFGVPHGVPRPARALRRVRPSVRGVIADRRSE